MATTIKIQAFSTYFGTGATFAVRTLGGAKRVLKGKPGEGWGWRIHGTASALRALDPGAYETVSGEWYVPSLDRFAQVAQ